MGKHIFDIDGVSLYNLTNKVTLALLYLEDSSLSVEYYNALCKCPDCGSRNSIFNITEVCGGSYIKFPTTDELNNAIRDIDIYLSFKHPVDLRNKKLVTKLSNNKGVTPEAVVEIYHEVAEKLKPIKEKLGVD